ncbi:MAG TPA: DUF58 domain-containing protein [Acidimicrobiales bacterium]|nr:DUF58 domain-containing protein [Acidimicrobiales bacterium]
MSCAGVLLAWGLVAHNSGAGWVQAVGDILAGILAVGLGAPAFAAARARVTFVDTPGDATSGLPVELTATATTRVRVKALYPPGPEEFLGRHGAGPGTRASAPARGAPWSRSEVGGPDPLTLVPEHRGVHDHVVLEIASAAPFGLLWWRKTVVVALPRALHVGPRLGRPLPLPLGRQDTTGGGILDSAVQIGEPRGVRPYRPGDHRRWVHWPATAHSGELMVREMEGPTAEPITLEVRLPDDADAAEQMAERAMATVVALVDRGTSVLLVTDEAGGPKVGAVGDRRSAGRRLACAVAEPATTHSLGGGGGREVRR